MLADVRQAMKGGNTLSDVELLSRKKQQYENSVSLSTDWKGYYQCAHKAKPGEAKAECNNPSNN